MNNPNALDTHIDLHFSNEGPSEAADAEVAQAIADARTVIRGLQLGILDAADVRKNLKGFVREVKDMESIEAQIAEQLEAAARKERDGRIQNIINGLQSLGRVYSNGEFESRESFVQAINTFAEVNRLQICPTANDCVQVLSDQQLSQHQNVQFNVRGEIVAIVPRNNELWIYQKYTIGGNLNWAPSVL